MGRSYSNEVGDRILYSYSVEAEAKRITLHTEFRALRECEDRLLDVIFHGVLVHRFECVLPDNVLFDVEEIDPKLIYEKDRPLFERLRNHGWPPLRYDSPEDLLKKLKAEDIKAYDVKSTCGLDGWVLAERVELRPRATPAEAD